MTICNMTIEGGAPRYLIAPDEKTFEYIKGKPRAPKGEALEQAIAYWKTLQTDEGAHYDRVVVLDAASLPPIVSWGSSPEDVISVQGIVPNPDDIQDETKRTSKWRALDYMGLKPGTKMTDITLDRVFIGSCTNGRIEDLREVAKVVEGKTVAPTVDAMIVPGSGLVKEQAEAEGLDKIFKAAGFDWREPGCSMCLAMNDDRLKPGERCASTSNRNFEGRQGFKGRTHLVSLKQWQPQPRSPGTSSIFASGTDLIRPTDEIESRPIRIGRLCILWRLSLRHPHVAIRTAPRLLPRARALQPSELLC